ncbi:unnamed protein product [Phytomonas sp. EM1]|nr:unnamed protein product [Phytomonas sp. EM1]|eukprot:CCW59794.1 unnamed protein product [Phytomonas sp. isolate EM1]
MNIRVNGSRYRCNTASISIKHRFGRRAVLVKNTPIVANPKKNQVMSPPNASVAGLYNHGNGDSGKLVICAVDAQGHFAVEPGGSYSIFVYSTNVEDAKHGVSRPIDKIKRRARLLTRYSQELSLGGDSISEDLPLSMWKRTSQTRGSNKYNQFVGLFRGTFANTSFQDAAMEWSEFSNREKRDESVEALVEQVRLQGRYQLHNTEA